MKKKEIFIMCGIMMVYIFYIGMIYPHLPNDLPMQFGSNGHVNWALPKMLGVIVTSSISLLVFVVGVLTHKKFSEIVITSSFVLVLMGGFLGYLAFFY